MILIYAVIVLLATIIGAIAGLGGGVIIKPLFDFLGYHNAQTIGVLSAFAVFTLSVVSIFKHKQSLKKFDYALIGYVSIGSFVGGLLGENLFIRLKNMIVNDASILLVQSVLLFVVLVMILVYEHDKSKLKTFHLHSKAMIFGVGLLLGSLSTFLGIGGGPLNIIAFSLLFSMETKTTVIYSICTVFFAQLSKLTQVCIQTQFVGYDMNLLLSICCFAVVGGFIGSQIHHRISSNRIDQIFKITLSFLLVITSINIFNYLQL